LKVVIPGGTHFLNLEKPSEFNRALREFLSDADADFQP
jgi:pimeloyl-ACP methyl ester carboxylesterase